MSSGRVSLLACCVVLLGASASAHQLTNGRITVIQADGTTGYNTTTQDRVDSISWIDSTGTSTGNIASNGGPVSCGDPSEFFGQSYDELDSAGLYLVHDGATATWTENGAGFSGKSHITGTDTCLPLAGRTVTTYTLDTRATRVNAMHIVRTYNFNKHALDERYNLRAYVPRFVLAKYPKVLVPDTTGTVQVLTAQSCDHACEITNWNGKWFADDDGAGNGIAIIRDKSSTSPAVVAMDWDGYSASNNSSILLTMPSKGWRGTLTETEWMCFYDTKTWPAAKRNAGILPKGCTVPEP